MNNYLPVRDTAHALAVAGGSKKLADKLFFELKQELPKQLTVMQQYATANNWDELWHIAHRIHGSTAICGVPALNQAVEKLEYAAKTEAVEERDHALKQVACEISRLLLHQELQTE